MTRWVLCRAGGLELGIDGDPCVDAGSLPLVGDAVTLLRRLEAMREAMVRSAESRRAQALRDGLAEANAIAESRAHEAIAQAAARFEDALRHERALRREREVELALAIVARIAGALGEAPTVAALARTAIAGLDAARPARVRVHPALEAEIRETLGQAAAASQAPAVEVLGDERLRRFDCEIDHGDTIVDAGLETQLRVIREALGDGVAGEALGDGVAEAS
jgi:type III secretion protein L